MRPGWTVATVAFGIVGMALSGCNAIESAPPDPLDGTSWLLVSQEERDPLPGIDIIAGFDAGSVQGSSGCNNFGASYRIDGDKIEIGEVESTLMACIEPEGAIDQEQEFITLLSSSEGYNITDGQLQLMHLGRVLLAFDRQG